MSRQLDLVDLLIYSRNKMQEINEKLYVNKIAYINNFLKGLEDCLKTRDKGEKNNYFEKR